MTDRAAGGAAVGAKLLYFSGMVLAWYEQHLAGSVGRQTLRGYDAGLRPVVAEADGASCGCPRTAKVCRNLLSAEPALRHGVVWRKTCHGTDSGPPSRFIEGSATPFL
jgi:hypothetical protein